jgi:hypothetical protein
MTAPTVYPSAAGLFRMTDNPGVWPHRGRVAAVGVGHSPTLRRWDGDPQKSIGAWAILAIRNAIEDAGVNPAEVDGIVFDASTPRRLPAPGGRRVSRSRRTSWPRSRTPPTRLTG